MIRLLIVVTLFISANADLPKQEYYVLKNDIVLGKIDDFSTIDSGYLVAKPTNLLLRLFTSFDHYVIYEEGEKPNIQGETKYKRDKYLLLNIVRELIKERPKYKLIDDKKYKLIVQCKKDKCTYERIHKKTNTSNSGYLYFENNVFDEIFDEKSQASFKRIK
jgi:hypothetical protein